MFSLSSTPFCTDQPSIQWGCLGVLRKEVISLAHRSGTSKEQNPSTQQFCIYLCVPRSSLYTMMDRWAPVDSMPKLWVITFQTA